MLLAIDIGNTNIHVGVYDSGTLIDEFRMKTDIDRTSDEYLSLFISLLSGKTQSEISIERCIIASVVPGLTSQLARMVGEHFQTDPLIVGPGLKTGLEIRLPDPGSVGADRIVNSVAAREKFGSPVLVVDFGTATTIDFVNSDGAYEGGVIAPGITLSIDALVAHTARLPQIEMEWPTSVIGKSTVAAMQSGAVIGYAEMVNGLLRRISEEQGGEMNTVATGGLGAFFLKQCPLIRSYEPQLTLDGLRLIADKNE